MVLTEPASVNSMFCARARFGASSPGTLSIPVTGIAPAPPVTIGIRPPAAQPLLEARPKFDTTFQSMTALRPAQGFGKGRQRGGVSKIGVNANRRAARTRVRVVDDMIRKQHRKLM